MSILENLFGSANLVGINAPEIPQEAGPWLNSEKLRIKDLAKSKKTILIDFWTYSCVNCLRTLPYLKKWYEKYAKFGLVIIGVHTPEFEFEKDVDNVRGFIEKEGVSYPIVLDSEYKIWNVFANHAWPRKLLIDTKGKIRYDHSGEGAYLETENKIRELLQVANPLVKLPSVDPQEHKHISKNGVCYPQTPETYCGYLRGRLGNQGSYVEDKFHVYKLPKTDTFEDGRIYLNGGWIGRPEYLQHGVNTKEPINYLLLPYHGLEVNAVIKLDGSKKVRQRRVYIALNDKTLEKKIAGRDVLYDQDGWSYLNITQPKMYRVIKSQDFGQHVLKLIPFSDAFQIYAFTFGGCAD